MTVSPDFTAPFVGWRIWGVALLRCLIDDLREYGVPVEARDGADTRGVLAALHEAVAR